MRVFVVIACFLLCLARSVSVAAHGGGLDDLRCHNDHQHGGYHCHKNSPLGAGSSFASEEEARRIYEARFSNEPPEPPLPKPSPPQETLSKETPPEGTPSGLTQSSGRFRSEGFSTVLVSVLGAVAGGTATVFTKSLLRWGRRKWRRPKEPAPAAKTNARGGNLLLIGIGAAFGTLLGFFLRVLHCSP